MTRVAGLLLAILYAPVSALAVDIVSDPTVSTQVTHCAWYLDAAAREVVPAPKDGTGKPFCKKDITAIPVGAHSVTVAFVVQDAVWGDVEGPKSDPLAFTRPSVAAKPSALKLAP